MKTILDQINKAGDKLLGPLSPEQTYEIIVQEAIKLVNGNDGLIVLKRGRNLENVYASSVRASKVRTRNKGFTYNVFKTQKADVIHLKDFLKIHPDIVKTGIKSAILIPLAYRKKAIGVLIVRSEVDGFFTDITIETLKLFGSFATLAIRKTELHNETVKAMETRDLFISMAAHELKTPLTAISGYAQLLSRKTTDENDPRTRWIQALSGQSKKLTQSIDELLEVNRIQTGKQQYKFEECSLKKVLEEAIGNFHAAYPNRNVLFKSNINGYSDKIIADCTKLNQAIISLLDNAAKFSAQDQHIEITLFYKYNHLFFEITDHGVGIEKKDLDRIFQGLYKKGDDTIKGLGLGLFLSRNIISHHNGDMKIKSKINKGTTVAIKLPKARQ
jgi:signal transduction histidine kinase